MKKCILMIAVLALSVLSMVSCKKDKVDEGEAEKTIIYATMDGPKSGGEKTHLGPTEGWATPTLWSEGDQVRISNGTGSYIFTLSSGAGTSGGRFTGYTTLDESNHVAFYPGSMRNVQFTGSEVEFDLPAFQYYSEPIDSVPTFAEGTCPMVAVGRYNVNDGTWNFEFKNLTGVLKLNLTGNGKVGKIVLKDNGNKALWGKATATASENDYPTMTVTPKMDTHFNELTLLCPEGVELSSGTPTSFYFVLPAGALNGGFTVDIYNDTYCLDQTIDFSHVTNHPIQRSTINNMSWTLDKTVVSTGYLPGEFNVGNGRKVHFSKGNVYKSVNESVNKWYFEKNQYDFRSFPGYNACIDGNYMSYGTPTGNQGLFGWSHINHKYGLIDVGFYQTDNVGSFYDWANAFDSSLNLRTLTRLEFVGLCSNSTHRLINFYLDAESPTTSIKGEIFIPADWSGAKYGLHSANQIIDGAMLSPEEWVEYEACGAVFLPAAGAGIHRDNVTPEFAVGSLRGCYYWASDGCYFYSFYDTDAHLHLGGGFMACNNGYCVRLVVEVQ